MIKRINYMSLGIILTLSNMTLNKKVIAMPCCYQSARPIALPELKY